MHSMEGILGVVPQYTLLYIAQDSGILLNGVKKIFTSFNLTQVTYV